MIPYSFSIIDKLKKKKIIIDDQEEKIIMKSIKNKFVKSDFDERSIRLYLENGDDKIYVDSEGRVLFNKESYYIYPSDFLTLFLYFEGFKKRK